MTTLPETLGRRIARLRLEKTVTQERLARELSVSPQAVSKWENDINYPDISLLPEIAHFLGVTVDELLSGASASVQEDVVDTSVVEAEDPVEIAGELTDHNRENITAKSSGFSLNKFFGKDVVKAEKTYENKDNDSDVKKKAVHLGNGSAKHGLHIYVVSKDGDVVDMCVPLGLAKFALKSGIQISGNYIDKETQKQLSNIDIDEFVNAAKTGESGTLVDITSADGDIVKIWFD